jgi:predicted PurR-regulated permease PerM
MCALGVATGIGLYLIGVPLAFTLALFTAFMIFIPYIGSIIAFIVTMLVTLTHGTSDVIYVGLLYIGIHCTEGYLLTPLVQRRAVYLPSALIIFSQIIMGWLLGFIGFALATPLTAATLVAVKMLYLHERPEHHG